MRLREPIPASEVLGLLGPLLLPSGPLPALPALSAFDPPESSGPQSLTFLGARTRLRVREGLRAALAIAEPGVDGLPADVPVARVRSVHEAIAALLGAFPNGFVRPSPFPAGHDNVVAANAVVEGVLEGGVSVGPGAYVGKGSYVGRGTRIEANATILEHCFMGRGCLVQSGAVIGCAGFGFFEARGTAAGPGGAAGLQPMPHLAGVEIGEGCFIGANAVVAAGVLRPTKLGRFCKLDSHVQIAHNVRLGEGCLLASQSGIAGSTVVGDRFRMGGNASVDGHLELGDDVSVAACSGVTKDLPSGAVVAGFPALPIREWRRREARLRRLASDDA